MTIAVGGLVFEPTGDTQGTLKLRERLSRDHSSLRCRRDQNWQDQVYLLDSPFFHPQLVRPRDIQRLWPPSLGSVPPPHTCPPSGGLTQSRDLQWPLLVERLQISQLRWHNDISNPRALCNGHDSALVTPCAHSAYQICMQRTEESVAAYLIFFEQINFLQ